MSRLKSYIINCILKIYCIWFEVLGWIDYEPYERLDFKSLLIKFADTYNCFHNLKKNNLIHYIIGITFLKFMRTFYKLYPALFHETNISTNDVLDFIIVWKLRDWIQF